MPYAQTLVWELKTVVPSANYTFRGSFTSSLVLDVKYSLPLID